VKLWSLAEPAAPAEPVAATVETSP
jgi:hypothetical protein